jgi:hypothetical protein
MYYDIPSGLFPVIYLAVIILIVIIIIVSRVSSKKKKNKKNHNFNADGSYSGSEAQNLGIKSSDIPLRLNAELLCDISLNLKPSAYIILSETDSLSEVNIRINSYVRTVKLGSKINLTNGDTISAVSQTVYLRRSR